MVPLNRRHSPRRGLRPPGAALPTTPVAAVDAATVPSTRAPARGAAAPTESPAVRHVRAAAAVTAAAAAAAASPTAPSAAAPADAPPRTTTAAPPADPSPAPAAPTASTAPPSAAGSGTGAVAEGTPAPGRTGPPPPPPHGGGRTRVVAGDGDWAATRVLLADLGARLATWRRTWTWQRTVKLLTSTTALLIVLVCGLGWGATSWLEAAVRQIDALDPDSSAIQDAAAQQGDQNFLVIGSDTRAGAPVSEDVGDAADIPGARTDTVMIVHVPEDRSRVTVVSFPRDLEITRPACERWDAVSGTYTGQWLPPTPRVKLNSAYAAGGPRCVTRVVQELSGLAVNRFLGVDFQGFKGMVDAVAGVPVCVERPIDDSVLGVVVPQAGTSLLTGDQALNYVRARHVRGDPSSDYGRIQRQQRFLGALLRTVLSAGTLLDPGKLRGLVDAISRSTFGENIGADQMLSLSQSLGSLDPRSVTFVTVPTTGMANDRGNEVLRSGDERALFTSIIENAPLPGTGPAPAAPVAPPVAPAEVRLVDARSPAAEGDDSDGEDSDEGSRNGGAASSVASTTVASRLRGAGFGVVADDRTGEGSSTTIRYSPDQEAAATQLAAAIPSATPEPGAPGPGTLTLTLGDDFDGDVRSGGQVSPAGPVNPTINAADTSCQ